MPAGLRQVGSAYRVEASSLASGAALHRLDRPASITFNLPIGMDPAAAAGLAIYHWDAAGQVWRVEPSVVDTVNHTITATVSHFSIFAVAGTCSTPATGVPTLCPTSDELQTDLTWPFSGTAASYNLLRSTTSGTYGPPLVTGLLTTAYKDFAVTAGTTYFYEVAPVDGVGTLGAPSGEVASTPLAQTSAPVVTDLQLNGVTIPAGGAHFAKTIQLTAVATDNVQVTQIQFEYQLMGATTWTSSGTVAVTTGPGAPSYTGTVTVDTLNPWLSVSYTLRVTANNPGNNRIQSSTTLVSDNGPALVSSASFSPTLGGGNLSIADPTLVTLSATGGMGATTISYALDASTFIDIAGQSGAVAQPIGDDNVNSGIPIGFGFPFFGTSYASINMSNDFWLSTVSNRAECCGFSSLTLPNAGHDHFMFPLTFDGDVESFTNPAGSVWTLSTPTRFIAEWKNGVPCCTQGGPFTFEVILLPGGEIDYVYQHLDASATGYQPLIGLNQGDGVHGLEAPGSRTLQPADESLYRWLPNATGSYDLTVGPAARAAAFTAYTGPISVGGQGSHDIEFYATDSTGAREPATNDVGFTIDASLPVLTVTPGEAQNDLTWTANPAAVSYTLLKSTVSGSYDGPFATGLTSTSYVDYNVTPGTTYFYEVVPVDSLGAQHLASPEASGTPLAETSTPVVTDVQLNGTSIPAGGSHFARSEQRR